MAGSTNTADQRAAIPPPPSHIISRPRLTRLLDETTAKIMILVAPAGYGKTTLAQEWLRERPHVWYHANAASADVASLALDLADAVDPGASETRGEIESRLAVAGEPSHDVPRLAAILIGAAARLPAEVVLVLDDYDAVATSPAAEELLLEFILASPIRLLVTGRRRPAWATARRLLYGEILELTQSALAMDPEEAAEVISHRPGAVVPGLAELAQGWPAVLGLAALTGDIPPADRLPDQLYDFFAEELYRQVPERLRKPLIMLSLAGEVDQEILSLLLGDDAPAVVEVATRIGFLSRIGDELSAHPLVQAFLERHANAAESADQSLGVDVAATLLRARRWDNAFALIERLDLATLLDPLITGALAEMVRVGRLPTLERWVAYGQQVVDPPPAVDLVKAEIALRLAAYQLAESLALRATRGFPASHPLSARAFNVAGNAAHLGDEEERGLSHHARARGLAQSEEQLRASIWGQLICANQLDLPVVEELVAELSAVPAQSPDDTLRLATMEYVVSLRGGGIMKTLPRLRASTSLLDEARDPLARTSFLNVFARGLALAGFYAEACAVAQRLLDDAERSELRFVIPHALVARAAAELGERRSALALRLLDEAEALAADGADLHTQVDARALRCRVHVSDRRFDAALEATVASVDAAGPSARREYVVSRALALLGAGRPDEALALAHEREDDAPLSFRSHEVRGLEMWLYAIERLQRGDPSGTPEAFDFSATAGSLDSFVIAYRGFPEVVEAIAGDANRRDAISAVMTRVGDVKLANRAGIAARPVDTSLSRREREVFELLAVGRTNKEIASVLYISDVTVKVHVRHILKKLGVRSRTEAAALGVTPRRP